MSHCSIFSPAALLTADPLTLGTAGVINSQTVYGETEFLDTFSMASLELFSLCACIHDRGPFFSHRLLFFDDFFLESRADKLGWRHFWFHSGDDRRGGSDDQGGRGGGG